MTLQHEPDQSFYTSLVHCLHSLAGGCPQRETISPALSRVRDLAEALQSKSPSTAAATAAALTLDDALTMIDTAEGLLSAMRRPGGRSLPNSQVDAALDRALDDLSAAIGADLRKQQSDRIRGLYVIIDPEVTGGRDPYDIAVAAVNGGARMLQLRDKLRDKGESLPLASALQDLCLRTGALLIVNDHADVAAAVGSGGLHVGQTDLPVAQARQVLAPGQVLGRSNREFGQLAESKEMGADHVAFGAIYATTSKGVARNPQGPERVREAKAIAGDTPLVAIGGINLGNVTPVVEAGADAICVTAAVGSAAEPESAAAQMTAAIEAAGGRI